MKQFLPLPILFLILPEVKQFFSCYTRCPNGYPLLRQRLGVNQKLLLLLFHGRNLILNKILIISAVYWSGLLLLFVQVFLDRLHSSSMIYLVMSAVGILSNNNSYQISVSILLGSHPIHKSLISSCFP